MFDHEIDRGQFSVLSRFFLAVPFFGFIACVRQVPPFLLWKTNCLKNLSICLTKLRRLEDCYRLMRCELNIFKKRTTELKMKKVKIKL